MEVIEMSLDKLKKYDRNAKNHTDKQIKEIANSINEFGFNDPIAIWGDENIIVEGHGRYEASKLLGLDKVPCIRLDHMSDEQRRAYTLAHNQLSLSTSFDSDILKFELEEIEGIDMTNLGFEIEIPQINDDEDEEEDEDDKPNERIRTIEAYNLDLYNPYEVDGFYQIPKIYRNDDGLDVIPDELIGFNYMKTSNNYDAGVHMYVDDYQFERLWNRPHEYIDELRQFKCVFTPDFSLYMDMPIAMKLWNVYRSRLLGQLWQSMGINVIPTISWAEKGTFSFCFDGIEKGCIVTISTIGVKQDDEASRIWRDGVDEMIKRIKPSMILVYGGKIEHDYKGVPVKYYDNQVTERMKQYK